MLVTTSDEKCNKIQQYRLSEQAGSVSAGVKRGAVVLCGSGLRGKGIASSASPVIASVRVDELVSVEDAPCTPLRGKINNLTYLWF